MVEIATATETGWWGWDDVSLVAQWTNNYREWALSHTDMSWYALGLHLTNSGMFLSVWPFRYTKRFIKLELRDAADLIAVFHPSTAPNVILDALLEHPQCPDLVHELAKRVDWEASV